jgi:hypothetical protein
VRSNFLWGAFVPLLALGLLSFSAVLAGVVIAGYGVLLARVFAASRRRGLPRGDARLFAAFVALGKLPSALGQLRYCWHRLRGQRSSLIEYKGAAS